MKVRNRDKFILEQRVESAVISAGCHSLLVAVSGGADSTALLCALARIKRKHGWRIECVNCNFHLRGQESDRDSEFTATLCKQLGIKNHRLDFNVEEYMRQHKGTSMEMACRELRYEEFFRIMESEGFDRIVTAHNSDDDIETMMLSLLRGSGTRGLSGMKTDTGKILRPLLSTSRREIEDYLSAIEQDYVTDSSNLTSDYRRNFIRREVLPLLETRWPGARKSLGKSIAILKEEALIIEESIGNTLQDRAQDGNCLDISGEINESAIHRFIEKHGGNSRMAREIHSSKDEKGMRRWILKNDHEAILEKGILKIIPLNKRNGDSFTLKWEKIGMTPDDYNEIIRNKDQNITYLPKGEDAYRLDKVALGDRIAPLGMKGTRLVSDILKEGGIPVSERKDFSVLKRIEDGEIIWVPGLKRSRHDLVKPDIDIVYRAISQRRDK